MLRPSPRDSLNDATLTEPSRALVVREGPVRIACLLRLSCGSKQDEMMYEARMRVGALVSASRAHERCATVQRWAWEGG